MPDYARTQEFRISKTEALLSKHIQARRDTNYNVIKNRNRCKEQKQQAEAGNARCLTERTQRNRELCSGAEKAL